MAKNHNDNTQKSTTAKKKKVFNLLMPHSLFNEIKALATADAVSINQFILYAVVRELERRNS